MKLEGQQKDYRFLTSYQNLQTGDLLARFNQKIYFVHTHTENERERKRINVLTIKIIPKKNLDFLLS